MSFAKPRLTPKLTRKCQPTAEVALTRPGPGLRPPLRVFGSLRKAAPPPESTRATAATTVKKRVAADSEAADADHGHLAVVGRYWQSEFMRLTALDQVQRRQRAQEHNYVQLRTALSQARADLGQKRSELAQLTHLTQYAGQTARAVAALSRLLNHLPTTASQIQDLSRALSRSQNHVTCPGLASPPDFAAGRAVLVQHQADWARLKADLAAHNAVAVAQTAGEVGQDLRRAHAGQTANRALLDEWHELSLREASLRLSQREGPESSLSWSWPAPIGAQPLIDI